MADHRRNNQKSMITKNLIRELKMIPKSYFSIKDAEKFYKGASKSLYVTLNRLVKKQELTRIMKSFYTFDLANLDFEQFACEIKKKSYISLEYALFHHGFIDQIPETITLITSGKSTTINTITREIEYSHVKKDLYFGYEITGNMLMATKEKAILDEIYLIALSKRSFTIKKEWLNQINKNLFKKWLKKYPKLAQKYTQRIIL